MVSTQRRRSGVYQKWNFCDSYTSKELQIDQTKIPLLLSDIVLVRE